jgi:hypothetical protein
MLRGALEFFCREVATMHHQVEVNEEHEIRRRRSRKCLRNQRVIPRRLYSTVEMVSRACQIPAPPEPTSCFVCHEPFVGEPNQLVCTACATLLEEPAQFNEFDVDRGDIVLVQDRKSTWFGVVRHVNPDNVVTIQGVIVPYSAIQQIIK